MTDPVKIIWYLNSDREKSEQGSIVLEGAGPFVIGRFADSDICLADSAVSRRHAKIHILADRIELKDTESANGTLLDGQPVLRTEWRAGQSAEVGPYYLELQKSAGHLRQSPPGEFPPAQIFSKRQVFYRAIRDSGKPVSEVDYLAIGGGVGNFVWVDHLRIFGVPAERIRVIGIDPHTKPYGKYQRLCRNSQIPDHERLRSNSASAPDNIWGFPGYALRETWRDLKRFRLGSLRHVFQVFGEPDGAMSYTPRSADVFASLDKEADRISWLKMWVAGRVLKIRQLDDGRYVVAYRVPSNTPDASDRDRYYIAQFVHIATGYPASRYLPELQAFKHAHSQSHQVVNAYEGHDQVYREIEKNGGTVLIRGRGIVASRVIQRLSECRAHNANIRIFHLMRSRISQSKRYDLARRAFSNDMQHQPFNWPKACWGGTLRKRIEKASADERVQLLEILGGTTTARRRDWERIISVGKKEGWYTPIFGKVEDMSLRHGKVAIQLRSALEGQPQAEIQTDYAIDCTGLIADLTESALLDDLIQAYELPRNPMGSGSGRRLSGIAVSNAFEITGLRNSRGRVYAAGVVTLNGPYAAVDSFLGLQYAALRSVDELSSCQSPHVSRLGPIASFWQWLKWCRDASP